MAAPTRLSAKTAYTARWRACRCRESLPQCLVVCWELCIASQSHLSCCPALLAQVAPAKIEEACSKAKGGHYQLACAAVWEGKHGCACESGINHPNQVRAAAAAASSSAVLWPAASYVSQRCLSLSPRPHCSTTRRAARRCWSSRRTTGQRQLGSSCPRRLGPCLPELCCTEHVRTLQVSVAAAAPTVHPRHVNDLREQLLAVHLASDRLLHWWRWRANAREKERNASGFNQLHAGLRNRRRGGQ